MVILGWVVIAVLLLFALLRIVAWDSLEPLIVVNALSLVVYLPAWIVAVGAAIGRRWWMLGAAGLVIVAQVVFVAPELLAASPPPQWVRHARVVRIFDANIDKSVTFAAGYQRAIESYHPDVLTFEEFNPSAYQSLSASGILKSFPSRCNAAQYGASGFFVASRWPLHDCRIRSVKWVGSNRKYADHSPTQYMVEATLETPAGPLGLRVVHVLAPLPTYWREWKAGLAAVDNYVRNARTSRMLMVGDFNATWGNRDFKALLGDGLVDGAAARGDALEMTWPNGAVVPPFARIDHVLTGASLAVVRIATGSGFGSDHHYVTASVAIRP
jgi:endonuclease/exonuclease/phosphatase (EEP) superfamily protein YafD